MAGEIGNDFSNKNNRLWANTLRRAIVQGDGAKLRRIADALIDKAADGDIAAIKELGDRIDGKATQALAVSGDGEGSPIQNRVVVEFVNKAA